MRTVFFLAAALLAGCENQPAATVDAGNPEGTIDQPAGNATEAPPASAQSTRTSSFTDLDPAKCTMIEENREEGPYWRRRCHGVGGYSVEWTESDLRQGLELIAADGRRSELPLSSLVAKGAFNRLGPRIEWRGDAGAGPDRLVARLFVANGAEPNKPDRSLLVVVRLRLAPCLTAIVEPGPKQSDEARRIADAPPQPCLSE